jgi:hypothetical protein
VYGDGRQVGADDALLLAHTVIEVETTVNAKQVLGSVERGDCNVVRHVLGIHEPNEPWIPVRWAKVTDDYLLWLLA